MNNPNDPITEADLCAYVDGELTTQRRIEVQDYLSRDPVAAAAVMSDLNNREILRWCVRTDCPPRSDVLGKAQQLDRQLTRDRIGQFFPKVSMAAMLVLCAFLAQDELSQLVATSPANAAVPSFADEAVDTHNAARLRGTMASEVKDTVLNQAAIERAMKITFPKPLKNWRVLDNRVVPSDEGPGLEISLDAGSGQPITFFAVPTKDYAPAIPTSAQIDGSSVAYWRTGDVGYALAGEMDILDLNRLATDFANNPVG